MVASKLSSQSKEEKFLIDVHENKAGMIFYFAIFITTTQILDTEAIKHMTMRLDWLVDICFTIYAEFSCRKVILSHMLKGILCVPHFCYNLISVARLSWDLDYLVIFLFDCDVIQDQLHEKLTNICELQGGIYVLNGLTIVSHKLNSRITRNAVVHSVFGNKWLL